MKILFINACVRKDSRTLSLCNYYLNALKKNINYKDCEIKFVDLQNENLSPLNETLLNEREKAIHDHNFTDKKFDLAKEFAAADKILIGAPYWDFSFPALLKLYIENICINQLTFYYNEQGIPTSLCHADKIIYITTAGGYISEHDTGAAYIKDVCKSLFEIDNFQTISAEGLDIEGNDVEKILTETRKKIDKIIDEL